MRFLYNVLIQISYAAIWCAQGFSLKMKAFVQGRKHSFTDLEKTIHPTDTTVWFHCASLGEFEQGLPIMEALKKTYPHVKLVITFFSPSGYEIKKNAPIADAVVYLPWDTRKNAQRFIAQVRPQWAFFVKYEFWPNYLFELKAQQIPTFLVSGLFRPNQLFFKWYGGFYRKALETFDHFFLQSASSQALLEGIDITHTTLSGDTRFDRVAKQIEIDNTVPFIEEFIDENLCLVCGSTWPEDEQVLLPYLLQRNNQLKSIVAPHNVDESTIRQLKSRLGEACILYSEVLKNGMNGSPDVLIIDSIGLLSKLYSYADIAYVGGAMGSTGLHNILEPATFGVPIIIGKHFEKFPEAERLRQLAGLFSIDSSESCAKMLNQLITERSFREKTGMIAGHFVNSNTGATQRIMQHLKEHYTVTA
ncbi:MAG: 3-deoxy-D-manno-octulosonic acid transferase [Flavobacteriaceae bacterium]|nr:3-deoxy-D-manno-octulosonic acid transferase [Flavobacteriaceae bacterium]|tara:strand:- start:939 stop:2192 length:1254 start_codon:yes stop_codon:yes gene_type:complete